MHAAPFALPVQSPFDRHSTQTSVVVSQKGPAAGPVQSLLSTHSTHSDVCVLHTGAGALPCAQSALVVHLGWHPAEGLQASLAGQSAPDEHPQLFLNASQAPPAGLPAQSALVTQPTQRPVDVLQAVP
jgi:hypothetical protein